MLNENYIELRVNEEKLAILAKDIASSLQLGDLVALCGDLGAGKTTLIKHIVRKLCNNQKIPVTSPTFSLVKYYDTPDYQIVHADLYRITNIIELDETGIWDMPSNAITFIEWANILENQLTGININIEILSAVSDKERTVRISFKSAARQRILEQAIKN